MQRCKSGIPELFLVAVRLELIVEKKDVTLPALPFETPSWVMELHISADSGCQQGYVFNLSLFNMPVLDIHLYIQQESCTRNCVPFSLLLRIPEMKLQPIWGLSCSSYISFCKLQLVTPPVWLQGCFLQKARICPLILKCFPCKGFPCTCLGYGCA